MGLPRRFTPGWHTPRPMAAILAALLALPLTLLGGSPVGAASGTPITACGTTISAPGAYYLANGLSETNGFATCITITASNVTLNLNGQASTSTAAHTTFIEADAVHNVVIQGGGSGTAGSFSGFTDGIVFLGVQNSVVMGVSAANASNAAFHVEYSGPGMLSTDNTFSGNIVTSGYFGFLIQDSSGHYVVRGNTVSGGAVGISIIEGKGNVVQGNTVHGESQVGIAVSPLATDTVIVGNTATGSVGVDLLDLNAACGSDIWSANHFGTA